MQAVENIFRIAQAFPDATAIIYDLEPVSYRAFHRLITGARRALAGAGLDRGGPAVVWIDSLLVAWTVDLALRSLGLDTVAVRDAEALEGLGGPAIAGVVTSAADGPRAIDPARWPGVRQVVLEPAGWRADDGGELEPPPTAPSGGHILLTSATTGRAKMVRVGERDEAINAAVAAARQKALGLSAPGEGRVGMLNLLNLGLWTTAGYSSAVAIWTIGGVVILHQAPEAWRSFLIPGLTQVTTTPALLGRVLAEAPAGLKPNPDLALTITGSALGAALAAKARAMLTPNLFSLMGSTEGGNLSLTPIDEARGLRWHHLSPLRVVEIVDEADRPLPAGQLGQVRVRLIGSVEGYLDDPDATARFFKDGFFYPGDLGVLDGQGRLALCGRITDVLNIQGDKVPAAPFEEALQEALGLEAVCVLSEPGADGGEELHVVLETAQPIDAARLEAAAQAHLRGFPHARFHFLAALPRNAAGKIERYKLKQRLIEQRRASEPG